MKKVVAVFAGVAVAGLALAAEVTTANTAVVVRKAPVESADGYQFLCVPVRGFDITGQGKGLGVPLNDVLPPANFDVGAQLQIKGNSTVATLGTEDTAELVQDGAYIVMQEQGEGGAKFWGRAGSNAGSSDSSSVGEDLLRGGAFLWLNASNPMAIFFAQDTIAPVTTFCGERNTLAEGETLVPADTSSGMVAYGNDTDTAVDVTAVCAEPRDGDEILRIKDGGKEYQYLEYMNSRGQSGWYYFGTNGKVKIPETQGEWIRTIAAGEAFYYYRRPTE